MVVSIVSITASFVERLRLPRSHRRIPRGGAGGPAPGGTSRPPLCRSAMLLSRSGGTRSTVAEHEGERQAERGRVTALELFFDLVVVFAFTQETTFLAHDPTWGGLLRAVLLLGVIWWAW